MVPLNTRVSDEQHDLLRQLAEKANRTMSGEIRYLIEKEATATGLRPTPEKKPA